MPVLPIPTEGGGRVTKTTKTISFDTERDADLLTWLSAQENVSGAVRDALRTALGLKPSSVTLEHVYQAVLDLEAKLHARSVVAPPEHIDADLPGTEKAAKALDTLGL